MFAQESWDLSDLAPEKSRKWGESQIVHSKEQAKKLASWRSRFVHTISNSDFLSLLKELETFSLTEATLECFAQLWFSENTKDPDATAFESALNRAKAEIANELLFFELEFVRFPQRDIERLIAAAPQCNYMLKQIAKRKEHVLPEDHEKLINLKDTSGIDKIHTLYEMITTGFVYKFGGKKMTQSELVQNVHSPDAKVRKAAYKTLLKSFRENESTLGEIYQSIVHDWHTENVQLRKYKSAISVRNSVNDIDDAVVETLMRVAEKNQGVFWRYFALKAKLLGSKKLSRFDLYAPIKKPEHKIPYADGVKTVLETFAEFSPRFHELAKRLLEKKHVHSLLSPGKYQGAYCYGPSPKVDPYVLLNYTDDANSVSTLAHELGHAIHYQLASEKHSIFHVHSALPVAETASIFCETVLIEKLKKKYPQLAFSLTFEQLDHLYASIGRQLEFVRFEEAAHTLIAKGASTPEIKELYLGRLKKHFGPHVAVPNDFANEWNYIPHMHNTPFYCYAYGFGNLLSLAVYAAYKKQGAPYLAKIISALAAGGSMPPTDIVKILGFDIADEKFWQAGFGQISTLLDDIETKL